MNHSEGIVSGGRLAQTFTPLASGPLVSAQIPLNKETGTTGDWILRLSPVDFLGRPTNVVLAEAVVSDATVPDGHSTIPFAFANPFAVTAGTVYALVLARPAATIGRWDGNSSNNLCAGQTFISLDQTAGFTANDLPNLDVFFTTLVSS